MNVKFGVNRIDFLSKILVPASRLNDSIEVILDTDGTMYSITKMESGVHKSQVTLFSEMQVFDVSGDSFSEPIRLNIGNSRKLVSALNQIAEDRIAFTYDGTAISYDSDAISFRFALLVDEAMPKKTVAKSRIKAFVPKTSFVVESEILKKLVNVTSCMPNFDKMYISADSRGVRCLHTDKDVGASDKVEMLLTDKFEGEEIGVYDSVIISEDVFKFVMTNHFDACKVDIIDPGIVVFMIQDQYSTLKYIVPKRLK